MLLDVPAVLPVHVHAIYRSDKVGALGAGEFALPVLVHAATSERGEPDVAPTEQFKLWMAQQIQQRFLGDLLVSKPSDAFEVGLFSLNNAAPPSDSSPFRA